jgi:phage shock protein B
MLNIIIVAIVFGSIIALATLICGTVLIIVKSRSNNYSRGATDSEEAKVIQEIYQGLERLEERIESLETILMDGQEKDGYTK